MITARLSRNSARTADLKLRWVDTSVFGSPLPGNQVNLPDLRAPQFAGIADGIH
jgi:hypothetical protein